MQFEVAEQLPAAIAITSSPAISLRYFLTGAITGGGVSATAQYITKGEIDTIDTISSAVTGGLTFGKTFVPSVAVNSSGAYLTAELKGEDARWKVASAVVGTAAGGYVGGFAEKQMINRAIAATIDGNTRVAPNALAVRLPANGFSSSFTAETINYSFDQLPSISDKKK